MCRQRATCSRARSWSEHQVQGRQITLRRALRSADPRAPVRTHATRAASYAHRPAARAQSRASPRLPKARPSVQRSPSARASSSACSKRSRARAGASDLSSTSPSRRVAQASPSRSESSQAEVAGTPRTQPRELQLVEVQVHHAQVGVARGLGAAITDLARDVERAFLAGPGLFEVGAAGVEVAQAADGVRLSDPVADATGDLDGALVLRLGLVVATELQQRRRERGAGLRDGPIVAEHLGHLQCLFVEGICLLVLPPSHGQVGQARRVRSSGRADRRTRAPGHAPARSGSRPRRTRRAPATCPHGRPRRASPQSGRPSFRAISKAAS